MLKIGNFCFQYFISFFLLFMASTEALAELKVQATVPQSQIGLGDTVILTVSVSSDISFEANEPTVPKLEGFNLINSWNSSSTSSKLMQTTGGMQFQTLRRQEFNFMLSPTQPGRLTIPPFRVTVNGRTYDTKAISIQVDPHGSGAGKQNPVPGMPDLDDIDEADQAFQQLLQRHNAPPPAANKLNAHNANEAFFVQAEVDKTSVYESEQVTVSWYIYSRGNMLSLDRLKFPDLKGFWKEIIEEVPALNFTSEVLNGVPYRRALLASHALFPIKPGLAIIDEYKIKASVQVPNGPFGFGPAYTFTRASERIKIDVKPLPTDNKPKDFTGAVGQFDLRASIEGQSFPANQPFSLKVRFDGSGNAKSIELPPLNLPSGLEIYDTKNDSKFFKNGRSYKEFEVLIIPRQEGQFTVPTLSASMFDPKTAKYYSRTTQPMNIHITPSVSKEGLSNRTSSPTAGKNLVVEKSLPNPVISLAKSDGKSTLKFSFQVLLWLAVLLGLAFKARKELTVEKERNIRAEFKKRSQNLLHLLDKGEWRKVGTEGSNLIYFVLGEISGQGGASLEVQKLLELASPSLRRELGEPLQKHIEYFQVIGFAPESTLGKLKDAGELKKEVQQALKTLEKALDLAKKND